MKNSFLGFSVEEELGNIVLERRHMSYDKEHCPQHAKINSLAETVMKKILRKLE
jgi:hypothetical protein